MLMLLLFFMAAWAFWAFVYPAHLHFEEQLQLFEFTRGYFCDVVVKPAGVAEYISRFLTQFFYSDTFGPVVVALVLTAVFHASMLFGKLRGLGLIAKYTIALVPALMAWAFLISMDAKLTMPVALCICLYAAWLTSLTKVEKGKLFAIFLIKIAVVALVLAFTVGSIFVVYIALSVVALSCKIKEIEGKAFGNKMIVCTIFGLALWGAVVALTANVYPYPRNVLTWGDYYNRFIFMPAEYNVSTWWATIASMIFIILVSSQKQKALTYVAIAVGIIVSSTCGYLVSKQVNSDEESMLDNMYLMRNQRWNELVAKYNQTSPATSYEQAPYNLALAMKGQLADRYFTKPQYGVSGLLPQYQMDYMTPLFAADAYYYMGMINTAQRFYYESMESIADHQKSAHLLKRLTMTALANGRPNLAKSYIHKLKNTLYYKDWATEMEKYADNPKLMDENADLLRLRKQRTQQESFFDDRNPPSYIAEMLNSNPNNEVAWQYLFTMLMVEGRLDELMQTASFYSKHMPQKMLPVHVQEALLYHWVEKTGGLNGFPWRVQTEVGQRFMQFAQAAHQAREIAEPIVRRDFADTFWCYAIFKAQAAQASQQQATDGRTGASQLQSGRE